MEKSVEKKRFYNIDFLRFVFCISILVYHFSRMIIKAIGPQISIFKEYVNNYSLGYISVDYFFIISGFFWCLSNRTTISTLNFAFNKYKRFIPVMAWGIALFAICSLFGFTKFEVTYNIETLFLLHGIGITHSAKTQGLGNLHPTWYVSALFWLLILFQYMYKIFDKKVFNLIVAIAIILGYGLITQEQNGILGGKVATTYYGIYNLGIMRGICGIGIGYFIGNLYKHINDNNLFENISISKKIILTLIQLSCLTVIFSSLFNKAIVNNNDIFFILMFIIVLINLTINKDYVSQKLNNKFLGKIGLYSYSIYVMHALMLDLFKFTVFTKRNLAFLNIHGAEMFWLSILACIVLGIITYHLIEKPAVNFLKNFNPLKPNNKDE